MKITTENPQGLKANLFNVYKGVREEEYAQNSDQFKKLFYSLTYFHAIINERKKFGAIGWNVAYDWMISDHETSKLQIKVIIIYAR